MDEAELFAQIADRDERAIETLSRQYGGVMHRVALRVTRAERVAEEVVQDALMAVWNNPGRYDPQRGALGPWLLTLTRYKAIDAARRQSMISMRTAEADLTLREAPDDVHGEVWMGMRRDSLQQAINRLLPNQRRALDLAFFGGLTHVEVADREGIALGTAKSRIRSALLKLRDDLGGALSGELPAGDPVQPQTNGPGVPTPIRAARDSAVQRSQRGPPIREANSPER